MPALPLCPPAELAPANPAAAAARPNRLERGGTELGTHPPLNFGFCGADVLCADNPPEERKAKRRRR